MPTKGQDIPVKTDTRSTDFYFVSPQSWPFISSSFVPRETSVNIDISVGTGIFGWAGSSVLWDFYYGDNAVIPAGQMTVKTDPATLGTGVTQINLPATNSAHGVLAASFRLTGLTPGHTYRYELSAAIVGGGSSNAIHPQNPYQIAVAQGVTGPPDWPTVVAIQMATTDVAIVSSERLFRFADTVTGTVVCPNASGGNVAIKSDGTMVVRTSQQQTSPQSIWLIDTGMPAAGQYGDDPGIPTIKSTITLAANEIAHPVAITPDNTRAWVGFQGTAGRFSTIVPINLSTGAFTTPASGSLGGANANPNAIEIDSTGTYAYVCLLGVANTANLKQVRLSDGVVTATANITGSPGYMSLSGSTLYVTGTVAPATLTTVSVSAGSMTVTDTTALPATCVPTEIEAFNDGVAVMISSSETGAGGNQIYQYVPAYDAIFTQWPLAATPHAAYDVALGPYGDIWVPDYTGQSVACWPGCQLRYTRSPTSTSDVGENSWVRITGAT